MKQKMKRFLSVLFCVSLLFPGKPAVIAAGDVSGGDPQGGLGMAGVSDGDVSQENTGIAPATVSESDIVVRAGIDRDTKGYWEGKYGSETAVLYGYDYTGEKDPSGARFAFAAQTYDMTLKSEYNSMTGVTISTASTETKV